MGEISKAGNVSAGIIGENAFIENEKVSIVFVDSENGVGVVCIRDRATGREFLDADLSKAPFWRVAFRRKGEDGATISNRGVAYEISVETHAKRKEGRLAFEWKGLAHSEEENIGILFSRPRG